ncbi:hypothetical protein A2702_02540 [Candidatus Amesbacteria bacterium RIFCSPHIGHO2_01_FULL_48_75]|nr:MAG: hypothetical protein A2702_02540 [Candidatus Amesbacteria bacterium RIFCSPHIGHO2_01_FULL_48_75]
MEQDSDYAHALKALLAARLEKSRCSEGISPLTGLQLTEAQRAEARQRMLLQLEKAKQLGGNKLYRFLDEHPDWAYDLQTVNPDSFT